MHCILVKSDASWKRVMNSRIRTPYIFFLNLIKLLLAWYAHCAATIRYPPLCSGSMYSLARGWLSEEFNDGISHTWYSPRLRRRIVNYKSEKYDQLFPEASSVLLASPSFIKISFVVGSLWVILRSSSVVWGSLWVVVSRCGSLWVVPCFSNCHLFTAFLQLAELPPATWCRQQACWILCSECTTPIMLN